MAPEVGIELTLSDRSCASSRRPRPTHEGRPLGPWAQDSLPTVEGLRLRRVVWASQVFLRAERDGRRVWARRVGLTPMPCAVP